MNFLHEVLLAIERKDLKLVRRLLRERPYLFHFEVPHGWPVLHRCIESNCADLDLAELYVSSGGDVNRKTNSGVSLLFLASAHPWGEKIAAYLKSCGAQMSNYERAVLGLTAGLDGKPEVALITRLVNEEPDVVHQRGDNGLTLLHWAARAGNCEVVKLLLERGADPNALSYAGASPLGCREPTDKEGMTCFELLVSKGANYTLTERFVKWVRDGEEEEVIQVLEKEPRLVNVWCPTGPLLHTVVWLGKSAKLVLVDYLLKHRVDPNLPDEDGATALHRVMHRGPYWHPGDDPHMYETGRRAKLDLIRRLLAYGANINQQDERGYTPLHEAAQEGQEEEVKLLVEMGAATNAKTDEGQTALDIVYAMKFLGHRSLGHWLKAKGACSARPRVGKGHN